MDGSPPRPDGLNTHTGPTRLRQAAVSSTRSVRVLVAITAPGASRIRHASSPLFPTRGPPIRNVTSSTGDHTRSSPTRAIGVATSRVRMLSRRSRRCWRRLGRNTVALRRTANRLPVAKIAHRDATPSCRVARRDQRRTNTADPAR